jgi:hypothetical protein
MISRFTRGLLLAIGLCLLTATVWGGRYLAFEYHHGDRAMVMRLVDHVL